MPRVLCTAGIRLLCLNAPRARVIHLLLTFGVIAVACLDARATKALDADAVTAENGWCIERAGSSDPPSCIYRSFLACAVAAISAGGSCRSMSSLSEQKAPARARPSRLPASSPRSTLSAVEREKLFREFIRWHRQPHSDD